MSDELKPPKKMTPKEFHQLGYLQELNRQFLHPLGMALEVIIEENGDIAFGKVWDYRDDPEGMTFWLDDGSERIERGILEMRAKAERIAEEQDAMAGTRMQRLGYVIQDLFTQREIEEATKEWNEWYESMTSAQERGEGYTPYKPGEGIGDVSAFIPPAKFQLENLTPTDPGDKPEDE